MNFNHFSLPAKNTRNLALPNRFMQHREEISSGSHRISMKAPMPAMRSHRHGTYLN